jgi:hypothetical protein
MVARQFVVGLMLEDSITASVQGAAGLASSAVPSFHCWRKQTGRQHASLGVANVTKV